MTRQMLRLSRRLLLGAALLGGATLLGAAAPRAAHAHTVSTAAADTVRGIVFDSLLKAPLQGITVMADIEGAMSTTDDLGAFTLVTKGTIKRLSAFGEFLDRTGIGSLSAVLTAQSNRNAIILATPSIETSPWVICENRARRTWVVRARS